MSNNAFKKVKAFWQKNEQKILVFMAIILASLASYRAGQIAEKNRQSSQINVSIVKSENNQTEEKERILKNLTDQTVSLEYNSLTNNKKEKQNIESNIERCAFVGSKNSNKYHLPTCRYATKIKKENLRCFSSQEEAEKAGYVPASCCVNKK